MKTINGVHTIVSKSHFDMKSVFVAPTELNDLTKCLKELVESKSNPDNAGPLDEDSVKNVFADTATDISRDILQFTLTTRQYKGLLKYVAAGNYYYKQFGEALDNADVLAFSFGAGPTVNTLIAPEIMQLRNNRNDRRVWAQWEIADILLANQLVGVPAYFFPGLSECGDISQITTDASHQRILKEATKKATPWLHRLGGTPEQNRTQRYLSTEDVAHQYKGTDNDVILVCQAWHAPRCWNICKATGINVVAGRFVDAWSPRDQQDWVRDPLSWLIKESEKPLLDFNDQDARNQIRHHVDNSSVNRVVAQYVGDLRKNVLVELLRNQDANQALSNLLTECKTKAQETKENLASDLKMAESAREVDERNYGGSPSTWDISEDKATDAIYDNRRAWDDAVKYLQGVLDIASDERRRNAISVE